METVSLETVTSYELAEIRRGVTALLAPLGGMSAFVSPGDRVLIKPNMLAAKSPDKAVTTHPSLVHVIAELVITAGGTALIGDSPGIGGFSAVAEKSGIRDAAERSGARLTEFTDPVELRGEGTFRSIHLARCYHEADKIINLPKLKTHEMMTMTCAVKNLFGAVVGTEKATWHLKAGSTRQLFARLLLEIYLLKKPSLTVVDALMAMEGNGPGSGTPIKRGVLLAGANPVAVDVIAAQLAGIPAELLPIAQEALTMGLPGASRSDIKLTGTPYDSLPVMKFKLPTGLDTRFGLPPFLATALKNQLTSYPVADRSRCVVCGICRDACPPEAITITNSALSIDKARCIRCWCCRELCPHDAMAIDQGMLLRVLKGISRSRRTVPQDSSSSDPMGISR